MEDKFLDNQQSNFISNLYRNFLIPNILGTDTDTITYWAGKNISKQYQLNDIDDLPEFFQQANLGDLTLQKNKDLTYIFKLDGTVIADRLEINAEDFSLESGIIAQTLTTQLQKDTEAAYEINAKKNFIEITARTSK